MRAQALPLFGYRRSSYILITALVSVRLPLGKTRLAIGQRMLADQYAPLRSGLHNSRHCVSIRFRLKFCKTVRGGAAC